MTMTCPIFGMDNTAPSTSATQYNGMACTQASSWDSVEDKVSCPVTGTFTLSSLYVQISGAPGAGKSYVFTVMKNGVATALTVTLTGSGSGAGITFQTDSTHSVTFTDGDTISMQCTPSGTPTGTGNVYWNVVCSGVGQPLLGGGLTSPSSSATNYGIPLSFGSSNFSPTEAAVEIPVPAAGVIDHLRVKMPVAPGAGKQWDVTLMVDGVASALTCSIVGTATTGSDLTHSVSIAADQVISLRWVPTGTPTAPGQVGWGMRWTPTTDGDSFWGFGSSNAPATNATNFETPFGGGANFWGTSETDVIIGAWTVKRQAVKLITAPGAAASGKSRTFNLRNAGTDTALSTTLLETATTGSTTTDVTAAQGDKQSLRSTVSGTAPNAATNGVHIGWLIHTTPTANAVIPQIMVHRRQMQG